MSVRIYKEVYFEASHRLMHYSGKCSRLHGHQWRVEFWIEGEVPEDTKILVDYNLIKRVVDRYDHQVILNREDPMTECISRFQEVITTDGDPTSELIAARLVMELGDRCSEDGITARVMKCRVWESTSCYAEWSA